MLKSVATKPKDCTSSTFAARDVDAYNGFRTRVREALARVKLLMDLAMGKEPRFQGPKIVIDPILLSAGTGSSFEGFLGA